MSWVTVAIVGGGALAGGYMGQEEAKRKQKIEDKTRAANAAATEVSWARKNGQGNIPQIQWNDMSPAGATFKGALGGAMTGASLAHAGGAGAAPAAAPPPANYSGGANALGGVDMSNNLGAQSNQFSQAMNPAMDKSVNWDMMAAGDGGLQEPQMNSPWAMKKKPSMYGN